MAGSLPISVSQGHENRDKSWNDGNLVGFKYSDTLQTTNGKVKSIYSESFRIVFDIEIGFNQLAVGKEGHIKCVRRFGSYFLT